MNYRGPGFSPLYDLALPPPPLPPLFREQVVSRSQSSCVSPVELTDGRGRRGRGWGVTKSYDGEEAWFSVNQSMFYAGLQPKMTANGFGKSPGH
jgi:hypothetical protein